MAALTITLLLHNQLPIKKQRPYHSGLRFGSHVAAERTGNPCGPWTTDAEASAAAVSPHLLSFCAFVRDLACTPFLAVCGAAAPFFFACCWVLLAGQGVVGWTFTPFEHFFFFFDMIKEQLGLPLGLPARQ